jgi:hypothetical protein
MGMNRRLLPERRHSETFEIAFGGLTKPHIVTVGFYGDDQPGEVFIGGAGKSGEQVEAIARDAAILLSMCLQHGVDLETIQHAVTRDSQDEPTSIIGHVVDRLVRG